MHDKLAYNREWKAKRYASDPMYAEKVRERARKWRRQNKERAAARDRKYYSAVKADPVRLSAERERKKKSVAYRRQDPEFLSKERARQAAYLKSLSPEEREQRRVERNERERVRMASDPKYKARRRDQYVAWLYGISIERLREMRASGRCSICGTTKPGGKGEWHVDHDHTTGLVRDILCHHCNVGLGNFGDDLTRLRAAVAYLEKHSARKAA